MANRRFEQFTFGLEHYPVQLYGSFAIGATGAVSLVRGSGIASVTRLAVGTYQIKLEDNYYRFLNLQALFEMPVTGSDVAATAMVAGTTYEITALGTTNFALYGVAAGVAPAVGVAFVATAVGLGTGTVKAVAASGIYGVQVIGNPQLMDQPSVKGAVILIRTMNNAGAATDPVDGTVMNLQINVRNSGVKSKGE
jgi:hypothetical protein